MTYHVIPQHLSIRAMRSSGYRDAAHAVAELIDNSIQAGEGLDEPTNVEVVCIDRMMLLAQRQTRRISKIAVFDNACGMDPQTMRMALQFGVGTHLAPEEQTGMGKFGMGLPNASISQCRRVDVWSWQDGRCFRTHLDVTAIENGEMLEVPDPEPATIPGEWIELLQSEPAAHGTLVVWSELDRITWKRSAAFLRNAAFLVGRMYRYFVKDGRARIRLAAYEDISGSLEERCDFNIKPNDPLYLMTETSAPEPYDAQPAFDAFGDVERITVEYDGADHNICLRYALAKPETRDEGGHASIGEHVKKNQGVSLVRSHRELEMNHSFEIGYDTRERWWGIEVAFEPGLDDIFGVTNNKQSATNFYMMDLDDDAEAEGLAPGEYREALQENNDPRLVVYQISAAIRSALDTMRGQIKRMREGAQSGRRGTPGRSSAESIATEATRRRQEALGAIGQSDEDESLPPDQRTQKIIEELEAHGVPSDQANEIAVGYVSANIKFLFTNDEVPAPTVFDVSSKAGTIIITINTRHPAYEHFFELLRGEEDDDENDNDNPTLKALKLILTAWARMEDEAGPARRQQLEDVRIEWGRIARDFLQLSDT